MPSPDAGRFSIRSIAEAAISQKASDVHIIPGKPPVLRINGKLVSLDTPAVTSADARAILRQIATDSHQTHLDEFGSVDFGFEMKRPDGAAAARFRGNACRTAGEVALTLRRFPSRIMSPEEINLPPQLIRLTEISINGLILVTGPTGSGKTTTLASIVSHLAGLGDRHIIVIEEPTEYRFTHGRGIVMQREVGIDTPSFAAAVKDALREDPNVIVVGEMRDNEDIRATITAAETGHLVFATLHTTSAYDTVNRVIDTFGGSEQAQVRAQLSVTLRAVLCQQLVPLKDGQGRTAAFEYMVLSDAVRNKIRSGQTHTIPNDIKSGGKAGMRLLDDSLFSLVKEGRVELVEALMKANNPAELRARLKAAED